MNKATAMSTPPRGAHTGFTIVEILVAIFLLTIAFMSILGLLTFSLNISTLARETTQAVNIAQDTLEAARNFRDGTDWDTDGLGTVTSGMPYHPERSGSPPRWILVQGGEFIDGFFRRVVFADVFRDGFDNIVEGGGALDPDTKKVIVTVSWRDREVEIATYLTNWQEQ